MRATASIIAGIITAAATWLSTMPAHAIPRTFVSGTGGGAACTRAAPCATFQAAHDVTDANGEINCLDPGEYGTVTITRSITIDCTGTTALVLFAGNAVQIDTAGVVVRLRNITFTMTGTLSGSAINFTNGAALFVENCRIVGNAFSTITGIGFFPPGPARLFVTNTVISDVGSHAVFIETAGTASALALIDGVRLANNTRGVNATSFDNGRTVVQIRDTAMAGNRGGVRAARTGSGAITSVTLDRAAVTLSKGPAAGTAVRSDSAGAFVALGRSTVMSNTIGLASSGGSILSYQNNHLTGNSESDGAPTGTLNPQ
jgi:hypothetical protein